MKFSLDDLVSASEFGRRPGQYIAAAADGRRLVIVKDNVPVAAVLSIADLQRLERDGDASSRPTARLAGVHPLYPATHTGAAWMEALGAKDADESWSPATTWAENEATLQLRVPIGTDLQGRPVILDLSELALGGTGSHGWVIGQTGSGKTLALETIVIGLAAKYSPRRVVFLIAGKSYGSLSPRVAGLPHVAAVFPEGPIGDDWGSDLATRLQSTRQERTESIANAGYRDLNDWRERDHKTAPPEIIVILDDTMAGQASNAALRRALSGLYAHGRCLGIHVLQGVQRLTGSDIGQEHSGFTIAFRVSDEAVSRTAVGASTAAHLPPFGAGLLSCWDADSGDTTLIRFDSYNPTAPESDAGDATSAADLLIDRIAAANDGL